MPMGKVALRVVDYGASVSSGASSSFVSWPCCVAEGEGTGVSEGSGSGEQWVCHRGVWLVRVYH